MKLVSFPTGEHADDPAYQGLEIERVSLAELVMESRLTWYAVGFFSGGCFVSGMILLSGWCG